MKRVTIFAVSLMTLAFTNCGIYNKYTSQTEVDNNIYGSTADVQEAMGDSSVATLSWREVFQDPLLQQLIDSALSRNTDLNSARIAVEQAEASLTAAKLGFLPSVSFGPNGGVSSFNKSAASWTYKKPSRA